jgi:hypothetical protein
LAQETWAHVVRLVSVPVSINASGFTLPIA